MIFATQRTGSNWLMGMLDAHPAVAAYDELLLPGATDSGYWGRTDLEFFEPYYARERKHDHPAARAMWSFRYLTELYASRRATGAIGMKLMYSQLWKNPWVSVYMMRHRIRVIHLVRRNLLDIAVSLETLKVRTQPHAWKGQIVDTPTITLDPDTLVSTLEALNFRIRVARLLLSVMLVPHLELAYEHLVANPSLIVDVFAFLEVDAPPDSVVSRFTKLNTSSKHDVIGNYTEIELALKGTDFERFLDD